MQKILLKILLSSHATYSQALAHHVNGFEDKMKIKGLPLTSYVSLYKFLIQFFTHKIPPALQCSDNV